MDEIGTEAKLDGDSGAKVKMCTPVHGLSGFSAIKQTESLCTGVHIFTFAHKSSPILLLYQSRPVSIFQLKQASRADCQGLGLVLRGECALHWIALNLH